eukprot:2001264-Alexandrium_andersonii.AAC.1
MDSAAADLAEFIDRNIHINGPWSQANAIKIAKPRVKISFNVLRRPPEIAAGSEALDRLALEPITLKRNCKP